MSKPVILTGIRAYTDLHIGNYFGALLPMVDLANTRSADYQVNLFVPDLHSLTTPIDYSQLQKGIMQTIRFFVAAGLPLDEAEVHVYRQSYISAHAELAWILNCFTGFGELTRMAEFKDKSARLGIEHIGVGQFDYPPLMAADILLYNAIYVPVGDDQRQHIEYTRDIAERMNKRFGELFVIPKPMAEQHQFFGKDQGLRIRDLQNPTKKMSKSAESDKGVIFLSDTPEEARKKIMSAETDSKGQIKHDYETQPGVSNLLDMLALFGIDSHEYIGQEQYGPLKLAVAEAVGKFLQDFQAKLKNIDEQAILDKLKESEAKMSEQAGQTLYRVQKAVGLRA